MPSPKPLPTALKRLRGNPGKRPLPKDEPRPKPGLPRCPAHLDTEARREWRRMGKRLLAMGVMTQVDGPALAAYCEAWSRWVEAGEAVRKYGMIFPAPKTKVLMHNPYLSVAQKERDFMLKALGEFGATPSSRSKVRTEGPGPEDEFAEFLRGNGHSGKN